MLGVFKENIHHRAQHVYGCGLGARSKRIHSGHVGVRPLCVLDPTQGRDAMTGCYGSSLCGNWFFAAMRAIADQVNLVRPRQLAPIDSRVRNKAPQGFSFRPSS